GLIYTTGDVRGVDAGISMCFNVFNGDYDGPVNVTRVLPWEVNYELVAENRYRITSVRQFEAEGTLVEARWNGFFVIHDGPTLPNCAVKFDQESFQWLNPTKDGKAHYKESLRLQTISL
ncbi:MAG: hypothetical protein NZN28_04885, partial [Meiothermus sp.]|uniref:hypothetical protein n=1 Tax=Meiothermus sp. TaxID=1955249 RepID=UPI0025FDC3C9